MIRYTYGQQAYKLLDIEHRNIISSWHVIFDEIGTVSGTESAPWNDPTVEGQWEGLIPEHLCQPEDDHTDEEDHHRPNHRPVGDKDIQLNIPEQAASPGIQELADQLEQLHLDVPQVLAVVMHSIAKVFLGSAKSRWAILMERPTSFWA